MVQGVTVTHTQVSVDSTVLFHPPKGDVWTFFEKVGVEFRGLARNLAPPRRSAARHGTWSLGRMTKTIYASAGAIGAKTIEVSVGTTSPHALYVLRGTGAQGRRFIYTDLGWANKSTVDLWIKQGQFQASSSETGFYMPVTRIPGKTSYLLRVKGQRPNPFLTDAYTLLRRRHSSLPLVSFDREFPYSAGGV